MATYRVRDRKGGTLTVHSKEQVDYWAGLGYSLVEDAKPAPKRPTARKSSTKSEK